MQRRRSFVESGAFVIASSLILLNNLGARSRICSADRWRVIIIANIRTQHAREGNRASARERSAWSSAAAWFAESINPLMTRTARCAFGPIIAWLLFNNTLRILYSTYVIRIGGPGNFSGENESAFK